MNVVKPIKCNDNLNSKSFDSELNFEWQGDKTESS